MDADKKTVIDKNRINRTLDADIRVADGKVVIDFASADPVDVKALVIMEGKDTAVWERALRDEEIAAKRIEEDFRDFVRCHWARLDFSFRIAVRYGDEGDVARVANTGKYDRKKEYRPEAADKRNLMYDPLRLKNVDMDNGATYSEITVVPYHMEKDGQFAIRVSLPQLMMVKFIRCDAKRFKYDAGHFTVEAEMPVPQEPVRRVLLVSRRGGAEYPMDFTTSRSGSTLTIKAKIDLREIKLVDPFWYVCIETVMHGCPVWIQPFAPKKLEQRMKLSPFHGKLSGDIIYYVRPQGTGICRLVIRKREFFDAGSIRVKEVLALLAAVVLGRFFRGKGYWLVFEKFCAAAQDNGYAFFRFCMEDLSEKEKKHIYYVIDTHSPAYEEVKKYSKNLVPFMGFRHMFYALIADMYVASESKAHLYAWRGKPSLIYSRIRNKEIFFLQHGVLALKRVEEIFGKTGTDSMTYIVTTSQHEQDIVVNNHGYLKKYAPILGLARWDRLVDTSTDENRTILVMPTWRKWIQDSGAEAFVHSDYFKKYSGLLQNGKLIEALQQNRIKLLFYMHPKFNEYMSEIISNTHLDEDCCELISFGEKPLNELIMSSKMLITDYSSVCWDFFYLKKPIIFYQFDYDLYMENHGSYIDMTKDLWGDRYLEEDELVNGIIDYISNGFREKAKYADMRPGLFEYLDHNNSRRTYEYVKKIT